MAESTMVTTKVEALSGYLEKMNKYGSWQKRYFIIYHNDHTLNYFPDDKKELGGPGAELDLCQVNLLKIDRKVLTLHLHDRSKYRLRFGQESEAKKWKDKLYEVTIRVHAESGGLTAPLGPNNLLAVLPPTQSASSPPPSTTTLTGGAPTSSSSSSNGATGGSNVQQGNGYQSSSSNNGSSSSSSSRQQRALSPAAAIDDSDVGQRKDAAAAAAVAAASAAGSPGGRNNNRGSGHGVGVGNGGGTDSSSGGGGSGVEKIEGRESWVGWFASRSWFAFSLFSLAASLTAVVPVPTLDFWFFKVFVLAGVLHGTAISLLALSALVSLAAHASTSTPTPTPSTSGNHHGNHHGRHHHHQRHHHHHHHHRHRGGGNKSKKWRKSLYAASGFCFTLGFVLVTLPAMINLPMARALPGRVDAFLTASGLIPPPTNPHASTTQPAAAARVSAASSVSAEDAGDGSSSSSNGDDDGSVGVVAFSFGEYLVDPPCALANVWEYYAHSSEIVFKTTPKPPTTNMLAATTGSAPPADWSGFGGLSSRNDSDTKLRLAIFGAETFFSPPLPPPSSREDSAASTSAASSAGEAVAAVCTAAETTSGEEMRGECEEGGAAGVNNKKRSTIAPTTGSSHSAKLKPVVLSLHGGGWYRGSLYDGLQCYLPAVLQEGAAVVAAEYRSGSAGWKGRHMVEDVLDALKWISNHGHKHGLDANKVVIMGGSAGAHLGLMAAYLHNKRLKGGAGSVRGVVARYGATGDLILAHKNPSSLPRGLSDVLAASSASAATDVRSTPAATATASAATASMARGWSEELALEHIAGTSSTGVNAAAATAVNEDELAWLSVPTHVSPWSPPTVVLHCTQDEFYDVNTHARSLEKALEAAGRPHLVITPMLHSHGCDIGSTVPFQFLRFALTKFLRAVKDSTGA